MDGDDLTQSVLSDETKMPSKPTPEPAAGDTAREYRRRFQLHTRYRDAIWAEMVRGFFQDFVGLGDTVLDLGAGWGEFIRHIRAARRIAMDINQEMPERVGAGVEAFVHDFGHPWPIAADMIDVVFSSNVFEHMADKPTLEFVLRETHRVLRPGGRLVCIGPNIRFLAGEYWDFWDHHIPLSDRSLVEVLELTGFVIQRVEPRFLPYSMSQGLRPPHWLVGWYLRFPAAWRLFGRQFLVVAGKASAATASHPCER